MKKAEAEAEPVRCVCVLLSVTVSVDSLLEHCFVCVYQSLDPSALLALRLSLFAESMCMH